MARATRNSNLMADKKDEPENAVPDVSPEPVKPKGANKKRKRTSEIEQPEAPSPKQSKSEDDDSVTAVEEKDKPDGQEAQYPPLAGDSPLNEGDAQKILDILDV
jgi:hypothetical protein